MADSFRGRGEDIKQQLAAQNIRYGVSVGRRAPLHKMHVDCVDEIQEAGLTPIVVIGSTNGSDSHLYNPVDNPLTLEQQKEQLRLALPNFDVERQVITLKDLGDYDRWCDALTEQLKEHGILDQSVEHFRTKAADEPKAGGNIRPLSKYSEGLTSRGLAVWESVNRFPDDDFINGSDLRKLDLEKLDDAQRALFSSPDYIVGLAKAARDSNPDKAVLEQHHIPVTLLDLSFDRMRKEAGITTGEVIQQAAQKGEVTLASVTQAAKDIVSKKNASKVMTATETKKTIPVKVASANLNQTVSDFTRNVPNIIAAVDKAIEDKADVLSLQELGLTGYTGDDQFKWIRTDKQQRELIEQLQHIADYANERDPNLVISVGFPFFYADKNQDVKINVGTDERPVMVDNPLYNMGNKPFNAVATISAGKIQAISAKSIQPEGAAEYEARQFTAWPDYLGATEVTLYNGQKVPFGKVVMQLGEDKDKAVTMYHEICAEAWPGLGDDGKINKKEQEQGRYLCRLVKDHDISLILNPSASKPEPFLDKPELRKTLCVTGSQIAGGAAYVYTNCAGLEAAPVAFEGGTIYANQGEVTHSSARYDMQDVSYSSQSMVMNVPQKGQPHVVIPHDFSHRIVNEKKGGSQEWESQKGDERVFEELVRNTGLWLRDYLKKSGQQGFFISLSGGQDSAFGAVAIIQMIELNIDQLAKQLGSKEEAVIAFISQFDNLKYADEVKKVTKEKGAEEGLACLKSHMLSCAYFPSENSSDATRNAAQVLIEGGTLPDGTKVKGIGGTFHIMPIQDIVDSYLEIFSGVDKDGLSPEKKEQLRTELNQCIKGERECVSEEFRDRIERRILSWKNKSDDLTLQNLQARVRLPLAWLFGNDENKIACVTSNWSEAVAGYWTFGGDGHMGSINLLGGIPKSDLRELLAHLEEKGLGGHEPVRALHYVNQNKASAELRPLGKDGKIVQFDENDMMPYKVLDTIARKLIIGKNDPVDTYLELWKEQPTYKNGQPLFESKEQLIANIEQCCWRWHASQFKRVAAVITPFLGNNVDPHTAVRTTIMNDGFRTGRAAMKLEYLKEQLGGEEQFQARFGKTTNESTAEMRRNKAFRNAVLDAKLPELEQVVASQLQAVEAKKTAKRGGVGE
ncbi:MAG: nitrilase-related carbon-nitrogen hydrolase [Rickettsiales bacterium]|nr:nitrilase-related carbon-nitrogen hydrolase [Rickettsiales bacterium]